jgi:hypothetical protein
VLVVEFESVFRAGLIARARTELHKLDRAGTVHVPGPTIAALDAALPRELPAPDKGPRE